MLTPEARRSRARLAGLTRASRYEGRAITARATAAAEARFYEQAKAEAKERGETCSEAELQRRARILRKVFYERITLASLTARAAKKKPAKKSAA